MDYIIWGISLILIAVIFIITHERDILRTYKKYGNSSYAGWTIHIDKTGIKDKWNK
jgi:hypothetical protein